MSYADADARLLARLWSELGGAPDVPASVRFTGPREVLPSAFDVTGLAAAAIGLATLATAELAAARRSRTATPAAVPRVSVDRMHAALAFRRELLATPIGWAAPALWDPIAGDYRAADGWVRLHTNYPHHRDAALSALGVAANRDAVAGAVARRRAVGVEGDVVAAGGCAAAMRSLAAWRDHAQGRAVAAEPVFAIARRAVAPSLPAPGDRPLAGVRVLDLTRVIAGPVCTGHLAAWGAEVLRLDPPDFPEVPALLPETTAGKRRAWLDLADRDGRARFEQLVAGAHVLVAGYRGDALARRGLGEERLRALNPSLVVASLDAYGWTGPWASRRGFDSLVQMSAGIAARGAEVLGADRPVPLPAQALDHATGYLLAAAACRGLTDLARGVAATARCSLARTAALLVSLGEPGDPRRPPPAAEDAEPFLETVATAWGPLRKVRVAGAIDGFAPALAPDAGPLGVDSPAWAAG